MKSLQSQCIISPLIYFATTYDFSESLFPVSDIRVSSELAKAISIPSIADQLIVVQTVSKKIARFHALDIPKGLRLLIVSSKSRQVPGPAHESRAPDLRSKFIGQFTE
jgi:hypothetical protein